MTSFYKYSFLLLSSLAVSASVKAQLPDDALKASWYAPHGSARNLAVGGAMVGLGGDISSAHINPAGLAFFHSKEIVFSPSIYLNNNKFNYRGSDTASKNTAFHYGTMGIVSSHANNNSGWKNIAIAATVTQLTSYNQNLSYKGFNNVSSIADQFVEELVKDGANEVAAERNYINGSSLAYRTYLIDSFMQNGQVSFRSLVSPLLGQNGTGINQQYQSKSTGGMHEIALALAGVHNDKLYIGGTLAVPIVSHQRQTSFVETDATNNTNNNFGYVKFNENFKSTGVGIGFKLGVIYKPAEFWRIGFTVHTPQFIGIKDQLRVDMTTNTEAYAKVKSESSNALNSNLPLTKEYTLITPTRLAAGISYVFREVENTKKQRAFLAADIEFVNYKGARFSKSDDEGNVMQGYYTALNNATKSYLKNALNIKLGGEIKFDPFMFRVGVAYYGSPYAEKIFNAQRLILSGGVGYRYNGMFVDLTYAYNALRDVQFAYRLSDKPNTFAQQQSALQNIALTIGFKL